MKFSDVAISSLNSIKECDDTIDAIEGDPRNTQGGYDAYHSGWETHLYKGAEMKIKSIRARSNRFYNNWIVERYNEDIKLGNIEKDLPFNEYKNEELFA